MIHDNSTKAYQFKQSLKMFTQDITLNETTQIKGLFHDIQGSTINSKPDIKKLFVLHDTVKQGDLVSTLSENWLVLDDIQTYNESYDKASIQRCNDNTAFNFGGCITRIPSIVTPIKFDIVAKDEGNFLVGGITITLPNIPESNNISIDQRVIFRGQAFQVSGKDRTSDNMLVLTCRLTELSSDDDIENSIPDGRKYENTYEIIVINGEDLQITSKDVTNLIIEVYATNKQTQDRALVQNPNLKFKSSDTSIATVDSLGVITPIIEGDVVITISLLDCFGAVVATHDVPITINDEVPTTYAVTLTGNSTIFWEMSANYTAKLLENGNEVAESFTFKLLNDVGLPLSNQIAYLKNVLSNTCTIQTMYQDQRENIVLVATSKTTNIEGKKDILLRGML